MEFQMYEDESGPVIACPSPREQDWVPQDSDTCDCILGDISNTLLGEYQPVKSSSKFDKGNCTSLQQQDDAFTDDGSLENDVDVFDGDDDLTQQGHILEKYLEQQLENDLTRQADSFSDMCTPEVDEQAPTMEQEYFPPQEIKRDLMEQQETDAQRPLITHSCESEGLLELDRSVAEYSSDILRNMLRKEQVAPKLRSDTQIDDNIRTGLVDWLVEVHFRLGLQTQTLFMGTSLLDRYLSQCHVEYADLRLVGIAALFAASKFEERIEGSAMRQRWFCHMLGGSHSMKELLQMECRLLNALGFNLTQPTALEIAQNLAAENRGARELVQHEQALSHYIMELSLLDSNLHQHYLPSRLAMASMLVSSELLGQTPPWPQAMHIQASRAIGTLAEELHDLVKLAPQGQFQAVQRKYASLLSLVFTKQKDA